MPLLMCPNDNAAMQTLERGGVRGAGASAFDAKAILFADHVKVR